MEVGEVTKKVRGGTQSGGNVLHGGDTGGNPIWIGDFSPIGGNREDGGVDTHQVYETNHGEPGAEEGKRDVGYSQGGSSLGSGGDPDRNDLHRKKTGDGGTVGGAAADNRGMRKVNGL